MQYKPIITKEGGVGIFVSMDPEISVLLVLGFLNGRLLEQFFDISKQFNPNL